MLTFLCTAAARHIDVGAVCVSCSPQYILHCFDPSHTLTLYSAYLFSAVERLQLVKKEVV